MGILGKFTTSVKKYRAEADQRYERRLASARTQAARERERASIQRERLSVRKEIAEAKVALLRAEASRKRASKEVRDIGDGIFSSLKGLLEPKPTRRVTRRRKPVRRVVARKPVAKKRRSIQFFLD